MAENNSGIQNICLELVHNRTATQQIQKNGFVLIWNSMTNSRSHYMAAIRYSEGALLHYYLKRLIDIVK